MISPTPSPNSSYSPSSESILEYLHNLERFMKDGKKADVLYDHQKAIIKDTADF